MMDLKMSVEKKSFVDKETNKTVSFFECSVVLNGEKFVLKPRAEDKKMFNYFLKEKVK